MISNRRFCIFCFVVLFAIGCLRAQPMDEKYRALKLGNTTVYGYSSYFYYPPADTILAASGVTEFTRCHQQISRRGKMSRRSECTHTLIDRNGRVVEEWSGREGKRVRSRINYSYNDRGLLTEMLYSRKGSKETSLKYFYNDSGRKTGFVLSENGRVSEMKRSFYDGGTRFLYSYTYGKDTFRPRYHMISSYLNDTGKLVKTELYTGKGKLKYQWDYNCEPRGTLSAAGQKKESRICRTQTLLPNGHRQFVYEEQAGDELQRYIYEYDSVNRLVQMVTYRGQSGARLSSKREISYNDQGQEEVNTYWSEKGFPERRYTYRRNQLGQKIYGLSEYYGKKGKLTASWQTEYIYNGALLARSEGTSLKKPGSTSITTWTYSFRN